MELPISVGSTDLLYKVFVQSGLIESNQQAKNLFKSRAASFNYSVNKHDIAEVLSLDHTIEHLYRAAHCGMYLRIGKKFCEQLSVCRGE